LFLGVLAIIHYIYVFSIAETQGVLEKISQKMIVYLEDARLEEEDLVSLILIQ
jgi:hypothetical protein